MNENNILNDLWEAFVHLLNLAVGTLFLLAFVGALVAPIFEAFLPKEFRLKMMGAGCANAAEIISARRQLTFIRIGLWMIAAMAWGFAILCHLNGGGLGY